VILRSISVEQWKCLAKLEISFPPGITIIHAPNRTGKSSLVEALKLALVDLQYDTARIKDYLPWQDPETALPAVTVEFTVKGIRYRMTKRFSKRSEGGAELYRLDASGARNKIADGKGVLTETQKILGLDKSSSGAAQLLWVRQGTTEIPKVDDQLDKVLRPLLGTLFVTEQDNRFRLDLVERLRGWFTEGNIKKKTLLAGGRAGTPGETPFTLNEKAFKDSCELLRIERAVRENEARIKQINNRFAESERFSSEAERLKAALISEEMSRKNLEKEVRELEDRDRRADEKRKRADALAHELSDLGKDLQRLQAEKEDLEGRSEKLNGLTSLHEEKLRELAPARSARDALQVSLDEASRKRKSLEERGRELQEKREALKAKERILELDREIRERGKILERGKRIQADIECFRSDLGALLCPDEKASDRIKRLLDEQKRLRAELGASQLVLSVRAEKSFSGDFRFDEGQQERIPFTPGEAVTRTIRQHLSFHIPDLAVIEVRRGEESRDVEKTASTLHTVSLALRELLSPLGIDRNLSEIEIVSELEKRRSKRLEWTKTLNEKSFELEELVPSGLADLQGEIEKGRKEKENIAGSLAGFASGGLTREGFLEEKESFEGKEKEIQREVREARRREEEIEGDFKAIREKWEKMNEEVLKLDTEIKGSREEVNRLLEKYVSTAKLDEAVRDREGEIRTKEAEHAKHRLTEEEVKVKETLDNARLAKEKVIERLNDLEVRKARVEGELKGMEGLHSERAVAERALSENQRRYESLARVVKAHAVLLQTFDAIRDEDIESSLKPVSDQVDRWLREIDGENRKCVVFGANLQVEEIQLPGGERVGIESATSFGEIEQLSTVVRLAYGAVLAGEDPRVVILDDPLAHSDSFYHEKMLRIIESAAGTNLQVIILTCHPERFDLLKTAHSIDLKKELG
jgi:DNA repair exonuclease SbcCD ATPase subunit